MDLKISVIVPNYNSAATVCQCIDSLLSQDFDDFEVIIVDDASTDGSVITIEEGYGLLSGETKIFHYAETTVSLTFIANKEHKGVSYARNVGIEHSKGAWLAFVDSDDYVEDDYLKKLYETAVRENADIVWCGFQNLMVATGKKSAELLDAGVYSKQDFQRCFFEYHNGLGSMWTKLYRAEIIKKYGLKLAVGRKKGEDWLFNLEVSKYAEKIVLIPDAPYVYCRRVTSCTSTYYPDDLKNKLLSLRLLLDFKKGQNLTIDEPLFECEMASGIAMSVMQMIVHEPNPKQLISEYVKDPLFEKVLKWKVSSKTMFKYKLMWFLLRHGYVNQAVNIVLLSYKLRNKLLCQSIQ